MSEFNDPGAAAISKMAEAGEDVSGAAASSKQLADPNATERKEDDPFAFPGGTEEQAGILERQDAHADGHETTGRDGPLFGGGHGVCVCVV